MMTGIFAQAVAFSVYVMITWGVARLFGDED